MDIEFSQIHEMVYMHDIVNSDSKKKPRIPLIQLKSQWGLV
jgi:hypothetical protein